MNASRSSEHPPVRGNKLKTFRWAHRLQTKPLYGIKALPHLEAENSEKNSESCIDTVKNHSFVAKCYPSWNIPRTCSYEGVQRTSVLSIPVTTCIRGV